MHDGRESSSKIARVFNQQLNHMTVYVAAINWNGKSIEQTKY